MRTFIAAGLIFFALVKAEAADQGNLVVNGDFETASTTGLPAGWTMWGAPQYKVAAHFTRDTTQPHAGKACFRIHHPAGTHGYVVSSPEAAIRPSPGKTYSLSFWARTDRPGEAQFGWTAYRSVRPFVDAPSPGSWPIPVQQQWMPFRFELHEGWDFFAEDCRYLLLTFNASADKGEERTLWIDDVVLAETPSKREGRLVNPDTLRYPHLEHRLRPGEKLEISVDASRRLREAAREVGGVSFHRVAGWPKLPYDKEGDYVLSPELEEAVRQMRLPMTRFYALGDEPFGLEAAIDKDFGSSLLAKLIGADLFVISTAVEKVALNFNTPEQKWLDQMTVSEAKQYVSEGHFASGSMLPKIQACIQFIENGGKKALITDPEHIGEALDGKTGTWILP